MSRFFATGSDSESETSSEEDQVPRAPAQTFTVNNQHFSKSFIAFDCDDILMVIFYGYSTVTMKKMLSVWLGPQKKRGMKSLQI